jgi:methylated-DNA-[protein]-cysteine S-methyltransferase
MEEKPKYRVIYNCPLGFQEISAEDDAIVSILYRDEKPEITDVSNGIIDSCINQLNEYFAGSRKTFDLNLKLIGTDFQKTVWHELLKITYGETITYLELANRLFNRNAIRAVGSANGKNPVNIIVPCHRVIGVNGKLVGYGGGLWRKEWLLEHEAKYSNNEKQLSFF